MLNFLLPTIISSALTVIVLVAAGIIYWQSWRRLNYAKSLEANLPATVKLSGLHEEVAKMESRRDAFIAEMERSKAQILEAETAQTWITENGTKYREAVLELPLLEAKLSVTARELEQSKAELDSTQREL